MSSLRYLFLGFLCLRLLGGDFAVLQVVAWTGMVVERAPTQGLAEAVESTLSGERPCRLCCALAKAKTVEREQEKDLPIGASQLKLKLKDMVSPEPIIIAAAHGDCGVKQSGPRGGDTGVIVTREDEPAEPPPRAGVA